MTDCGCDKAKAELEEYLHRELSTQDFQDITDHLEGEARLGLVQRHADACTQREPCRRVETEAVLGHVLGAAHRGLATEQRLGLGGDIEPVSRSAARQAFASCYGVNGVWGRAPRDRLPARSGV